MEEKRDNTPSQEEGGTDAELEKLLDWACERTDKDPNEPTASSSSSSGLIREVEVPSIPSDIPVGRHALSAMWAAMAEELD